MPDVEPCCVTPTGVGPSTVGQRVTAGGDRESRSGVTWKSAEEITAGLNFWLDNKRAGQIGKGDLTQIGKDNKLLTAVWDTNGFGRGVEPVRSSWRNIKYE